MVYRAAHSLFQYLLHFKGLQSLSTPINTICHSKEVFILYRSTQGFMD